MTANMMQEIVKFFTEGIPQCKDLGILVNHIEPGKVKLQLPCASYMQGNLDFNFIHGGIISTLIDTACGITVISALHGTERVATLDLRIDNLRPAEMGQDLYVEAECCRLTEQIAFTDAIAYQDKDKPFSLGRGTFMRLGKYIPATDVKE